MRLPSSHSFFCTFGMDQNLRGGGGHPLCTQKCIAVHFVYPCVAIIGLLKRWMGCANWCFVQVSGDKGVGVILYYFEKNPSEISGRVFPALLKIFFWEQKFFMHFFIHFCYVLSCFKAFFLKHAGKMHFEHVGKKKQNLLFFSAVHHM